MPEQLDVSLSWLTPPAARENWKSAGRAGEKEKDAGKKRALPKRDPLPRVKSAEWKNRTSDGLITDSACELLNLQLLRHRWAHLAQADSKKSKKLIGRRTDEMTFIYILLVSLTQPISVERINMHKTDSTNDCLSPRLIELI